MLGGMESHLSTQLKPSALIKKDETCTQNRSKLMNDNLFLSSHLLMMRVVNNDRMMK